MLARLVLIAAAGCLLLLSGIFLLRRLAGAFGHALAPEALIVLAAMVTAVVAGIRGTWRRLSRPNTMSPHGRTLLLDGTLCLAVFCLAASMSVRGTETVSLVFFWCIFVAGEFVGWAPYYRRLVRLSRARGGRDTRQREDVPTTNDETARELSAAAIHEGSMLEEPDEDDGFELLSSNVSQRITRGRDENGVEAVFGVVRCDFAMGQRHQNLHIAFCPPLERAPELTTDQIDGPMAKIKPSMVEVFGAGLEVKLPAPCSEPTSVQIQFYAFERPDDVTPSV